MLQSLTLLTILSLVPTFSQVPTVYLPVTEGIEFLGQTLNIYSKDTQIGNQIIDITYNYNLTTPAYDYRVPDNYIYTGYRYCSFTPRTITAQTRVDFMERYAERFRVQSDLWNYIDSFNEEVRWALKQIEDGKIIEYSEIGCVLHNLELLPGVRLNKWFIDEVLNLPNEINGDNLQQFMNFFDTYGDHVITKCSVGGTLSQIIATDREYLKGNNTMEDLKNMARMQLMVEVDSSKSQRYKIDQEFLQASQIMTVRPFGGLYASDEENWSEWQDSILREKSNLVCTSIEAAELTTLFDQDHRLTGKKHLMQKALDIYLNKPSCNHVEFATSKPLGAFFKISDAFNCQKEAIGAYWLLEGADVNNECLVSWSFLRGSGKKVIGQTQLLRTDFNKAGVVLNGIIVRDSDNCSTKFLGSNITYVVRDPSKEWHYYFVDSCRVPIDKPYAFKIYPKNFSRPAEESQEYFEMMKCQKQETVQENFNDQFDFYNSQSYRTIRNSCKTAYCTKLISEKSVYNSNVTTLALITITKDWFDPIWDSDLREYYLEQ